MKKIIQIVLFLLVTTFPLLAQSYHTITIDGTNDFNTTYERFNTTSGTNAYFYATWDADYLYFGFSGTTPAGSITDNDRVYHLYIDTDPNPTPTNGSGTTDGEAWRYDPTLPFTANYHYAFKTIDNSEYRRVYSTAWGNSSFATSNWKGSGFWELRIKRSDIGTPTKIYVVGYVEEDWTNGSICAGAPSNLFTNTSTGGAITFENHRIGFELTSGINPNDSNNFDPALPVELSTFTAAIQNKVVVLNWSTATEINNYGFEVEKSLDKVNWKNIGFINGFGNSNVVRDYTFTDKEITVNGVYYYRLKQIDNNGNFTYSGVAEVNVNMPIKFNVEQNYPNPFNPVTNISFSIPEAANVNLYVYNAIGQQIKLFNLGYKNAGKHSVSFDGSELNSGIYFYKIEAGNNSMIRKMVLVK